MDSVVKLQPDKKEYLRDLDNYITKLQNQPSDKAQKEAEKALKRTGVTTRNGKLKKKIVSWE